MHLDKLTILPEWKDGKFNFNDERDEWKTP
jgi:hypothetical protein